MICDKIFKSFHYSCYLKTLFYTTTSFLTNQLQMKKNHLLVTMKRICQLVVLLVDDEADLSTWTGNATGLWLKICNYLCIQKEIYLYIVFFCKIKRNFPFQ